VYAAHATASGRSGQISTPAEVSVPPVYEQPDIPCVSKDRPAGKGNMPVGAGGDGGWLTRVV